MTVCVSGNWQTYKSRVLQVRAKRVGEPYCPKGKIF